jgi:hypothetical protein
MKTKQFVRFSLLRFLTIIGHYTSYHFITVRNHNGGKPYKLSVFLAKFQTWPKQEMTRFWNHRVQSNHRIEKEKVRYLKAFRMSFLWKPKKNTFQRIMWKWRFLSKKYKKANYGKLRN